jgi:hypothetical protein
LTSLRPVFITRCLEFDDLSQLMLALIALWLSPIAPSLREFEGDVLRACLQLATPLPGSCDGC